MVNGGMVDETVVISNPHADGGGNYCPDAAVTHGQMAVFLVRG